MPLVLGFDLGTTTLTALAVDCSNGRVAARSTVANDGEITTPDAKARGRSEWDAEKMVAAACRALRAVAAALGDQVDLLAGIGLTGQQHGMLLVDDSLAPLTPFINWQDRRANEINPRTGKTFLDDVRSLTGPEARRRTGCTPAAGYMGVTLYWLAQQASISSGATACFAIDYLAAALTGAKPATDASSAASSGLFDVRSGVWDQPSLEGLALPPELFPAILQAGEPHGQLTAAAARETGLAAGLAVCTPAGDNQASVYGSVADLDDTILVNVGTGGQVAAFSPRFVLADELETRPFPDGFLLVSAGLCGGRTYALLERFFRQAAAMAGSDGQGPSLFAAMNRLADTIAPGADGLRCDPCFTGTRAHPELRGAFTGLSAENFTPAHLTRALLEGMARLFSRGRREIEALVGPRGRLVGSGNALRENPVFARIVADELGMPLELPQHREEAAFGAVLLAARGLGLLANRQDVARLIRYEKQARGLPPGI